MFLYKIYQYVYNWYYGIEEKKDEDKEQVGGCPSANKEKKDEDKAKKVTSSGEVLETDAPAEKVVENKKVK